MNLSKKAITAAFQDAAATLHATEEGIAAVSTDANFDLAEKEIRSLMHREKMYNGLASLSDKAKGLLYAQMKHQSTSIDQMLGTHVYGIKRVITLLEALAEGQPLVMSKDTDSKNKLGLVFDYMKAKKTDHMETRHLKRETGDKTASQSTSIERALKRLGVVDRERTETKGNFKITLKDSPLTEKIKEVWGF